MPSKCRPSASLASPRHGLARILSKWGVCSRTEATAWILAGRVTVAGRVVRDPEHPYPLDVSGVAIDGRMAGPQILRVLMLHKPRGAVVTRRDERARATVYAHIPAEPWLFPVGRLDQASSGLLLFANDPVWADTLMAPERHVPKTYHVQVRPPLTNKEQADLATGGRIDGVEYRPFQLQALRCGGKTQWLECILEEGRNRQIRHILASREREVLRLIRVAMGGLPLGDLTEGAWRWLDEKDLSLLRT